MYFPERREQGSKATIHASHNKCMQTWQSEKTLHPPASICVMPHRPPLLLLLPLCTPSVHCHISFAVFVFVEALAHTVASSGGIDDDVTKHSEPCGRWGKDHFTFILRAWMGLQSTGILRMHLLSYRSWGASKSAVVWRRVRLCMWSDCSLTLKPGADCSHCSSEVGPSAPESYSWGL